MLHSSNDKEKSIIFIGRIILLIRVIAGSIVLPFLVILFFVFTPEGPSNELVQIGAAFMIPILIIIALIITISSNVEKITAQLALNIIKTKKASSVSKKDLSLSISYAKYTKRSNRKLKLILLIFSGVFFWISWEFTQINLLSIPTMLLILVILLGLKEQVMEHRIQKGFFGTNQTEARALIKFILKNAEDIDFNDSNGNLRRALLPEAEPATTEQTLPAFGEEATA